MATNNPTMIAGAEEPATLSGLCQPMAIFAMVGRKEALLTPDLMSLPPKLSWVDDSRSECVVEPSEKRGCCCRRAPPRRYWSGEWIIWGGREKHADERLRDQQFSPAAGDPFCDWLRSPRASPRKPVHSMNRRDRGQPTLPLLSRKSHLRRLFMPPEHTIPHL